MEDGKQRRHASPLSIFYSPSTISWLVLIAMLALNIVVRLRLAPTPLERDEGEYAYAGQLILRGIAPYVHAYNMKFPGTYMGYALIMSIFGQTAEGIHRGMAAVTSINLVLLFFLTRRFFGNAAAIPATVFFGLMQLDVRAMALSGHATHWVMLWALGGFLLMPRSKSPDDPRHPRQSRGLMEVLFALAGVCFGFATLAKQPGGAFVIVAESWLVIQFVVDRRWKQWLTRSLLVGVGSVVPLVLTALWLWHAGALAAAKFWTIDYARAYGGEYSWSFVLGGLRFYAGYTITFSRWLWLIGAIGLVAVGFTKRLHPQAILVVILALGSVLAFSVGFHFRPHYFILMMPAAALGVGALHSVIAERGRRLFWLRQAWLLVWIGVAVQFVVSEYQVFFDMTPAEVCQYEYGPEVFPIAADVSRYLSSHSTAADTIAVIGSEPEIYFYAHRLSATGYIYTYPMMEPQPFAAKMQREMSAQIEAARPLYIVTISTWTSWGTDANSDRWIFNWWDAYSSHYKLVPEATDGPIGPDVDTRSGMTSPGGGTLAVYRRVK